MSSTGWVIFNYDHCPCQVLQNKMEELKSQTDMLNQKHAAKIEELSLALKEKQDLIQNLQMKLKESEVGLKYLEMAPALSADL